MSRREAERLARLLEEGAAPKGLEGAADHGGEPPYGLEPGAPADPSTEAEGEAELVRLASLAQTLEQSAAQPAPPFRTALRERVLATVADEEPAPAWRARVGGMVGDVVAAWHYSGRTAVASGTLTVLLLLASLFVGASLSLPGDPLYAIKDAYQQAQLARASTPADVAAVKLEMAGTKIDEAARAADRGRLDSLAISAGDAEHLARDGAETLLGLYRDTGDPAVVEPLAHFVAQHRPTVAELHAAVADTDAGRALNHLLLTLNRIDDRTRTVLGGCCPAERQADDSFWTISAPGQPFAECPCEVEPEEVDEPDDAGAIPTPERHEELRPRQEDWREEFREEVEDTHDGLRDDLEGATDAVPDETDDATDPVRDEIDDAVDDATDALDGGDADDGDEPDSVVEEAVEGLLEPQSPTDDAGGADDAGGDDDADDRTDSGDAREAVEETEEEAEGTVDDAGDAGDAGDANDASDADAGAADDGSLP